MYVCVLNRDMVHGRPDARSGELKQMGRVCVRGTTCCKYGLERLMFREAV